ncbi:MAG: hypothetical protein AABZ34_04150 [Nitrospirota bacterium]
MDKNLWRAIRTYWWISMESVFGKSLLIGLLICATALSVIVPWAASAEIMNVTIGMSMQDVITIIGEPDRKAVLSGKVLRDFTEVNPETAVSKSRIVFIYETDNVQVWFRQGRVTGMTKDGVSILRPKPP